MSIDEIKKLCKIFARANEGCPHCAEGQVEAFNELFPEFNIEFKQGDDWDKDFWYNSTDKHFIITER